MSDVWTEARVDALKALFRDGLSASMIASELGAGLTRNAVIGKIARLGISRQGGAIVIKPKVARPAAEPHPRRERTKLGRGPTNSRTERRIAELQDAGLAVDEFRDLPPEVLPEGQGKTILELGDKTCRWPVGDPSKPDFLYCGATDSLVDIVAGHPYCARHARVAFTPTPPMNGVRSHMHRMRERPAR